MARPRVDLTGKRFNRMTVLAAHELGRKGRGSRWLCRCDCGTEKVVRGSDLYGETKSCGCLSKEMNPSRGRPGVRNPNWGGGLTTTQEGYVLRHCPEHPCADRHGYVREHRLVMEESLGRVLTDVESVHHRNGIRSDNRVENLELWSSEHPPGQRVEDLVAFAKEILRKYDQCVVDGEGA